MTRKSFSEEIPLWKVLNDRQELMMDAEKSISKETVGTTRWNKVGV